MKKLNLKECLKREVPDIDYRILKSQMFQRISAYDEKRKRQSLYFVPRVGMSLLLILFVINLYSLLQEMIYNLGMRGIGVNRIHTLPIFSPHFFFKAIAVFGDNLLSILTTLSLILLLDRRFFGLYKVYRFLRHNLSFLKNVIVKIPTFAWAIFRGRP